MQTVASLVSTVQDLMEELKISATTALDNRILGSLAVPSSTGVPVLQTTEVRVDLSAACHHFFSRRCTRGRISDSLCFRVVPFCGYQRTASSVGIDRAALDELTAKHEELITQRVSFSGRHPRA